MGADHGRNDLMLISMLSALPSIAMTVVSICAAVQLYGVSAFHLFQSPLAQAVLYPPARSFSESDLNGQSFAGEVLHGVEFAGVTVRSVDFSGADLRGTTFSMSWLTDVDFSGADLSDAMLDQATITRANFDDANLTGVLFLRSKLEEVSIHGADFSEAILDGVQVKELCKIADGTNSQTGIMTRDSLYCPS